MNKKEIYFTKHLPVEGKIKEGDTVTDGVIIYPITLEKWRVLQKDKTKHLLTKIKRVKLYLCSRDIQVGDKVHYEGKEGEFEASIWDTTSTGGNLNTYKVLGEVSSEAVWVTEGMEFSEDEWQLCILNDHDDWLPVDKRADWSEMQTRIRIKCSQCKTFH